jgi:hypothetical protein
MKCPQIIADDGFSMCYMDKNVDFIFSAPMITFWCFVGLHFQIGRFYNSNFVSQIYKILEDLGIISSCQQDDIPHLYKFFIVRAPAQKFSILDAHIL